MNSYKINYGENKPVATNAGKDMNLIQKYKIIMRSYNMAWAVFVPGLFYLSCSPPAKRTAANSTLTKGEVTIYADEAYTNILNDQRFVYYMRYDEADITLKFMGEDSAMNALLDDKVKIAVVSQMPSQKNIDYFKSKGDPLVITPIASDAIVLIANKSCPLSSITRNQLTQLLNGTITEWQDLVKSDKAGGKVLLGFDQPGSGIIKYFRKYYLKEGEHFSANSGTFKGTRNLLDSLVNHPNMIGFIPYNFISDKDDTLCQAIKRDFKVISLQSLKDSGQFVLPSQSSIGDSAYPLIRKILVVNHEGKSGLGTGFVIFMASHQGQRLMLKAGLVPAIMPGRAVRFIQQNATEQ
ncbi:MAG TPA: substrate-binding domain-containing protein [Flavobacteriales bacterium]|nr:substrate-binding domain-containing protein [Flavobacteriales bacterium]